MNYPMFNLMYDWLFMTYIERRYKRLMILVLEGPIEDGLFKFVLKLIPSEDQEMRRMADILMDEIEHQQWKSKQLI